MCYFEQVRFTCGSWRWGPFREQCNKEYRTGETCGLKLVFSSRDESRDCKACIKIATKQRQITKMTTDLERWKRDGNRPATVEKTESDVVRLQYLVSQLRRQHVEGLFGGTQFRHRNGTNRQRHRGEDYNSSARNGLTLHSNRNWLTSTE